MVRPLAVRRHNEIVQRLRAAGSVSVGELANIFGVSHETIRRDLKLLADHGHLDVVHGGAARQVDLLNQTGSKIVEKCIRVEAVVYGVEIKVLDVEQKAGVGLAADQVDELRIRQF